MLRKAEVWIKFYILLLFAASSYGRVPSVRLCADEKCLNIISVAKTVINFHGSHPSHVSFKGNIQCRVMAKSSGENSDLWEIEVQGRRGYAPRNMIMEQKILVKAENLIEVKSISESASPPDVVKNVTIEEDYSSNTTRTEENKEQNDLKSDETIITKESNAEIDEADHMTDIDRHQEIIEQEPNESNDSNEHEEKQEEFNLKPVDEPIAIERDIYKTGYQDIKINTNEHKDEKVRLEVIGIQQEKDEDTRSSDYEVNEGAEPQININKNLVNDKENVLKSDDDSNVGASTADDAKTVIEKESSILEKPKPFEVLLSSEEQMQEPKIIENSTHSGNNPVNGDNDLNDNITTNLDGDENNPRILLSNQTESSNKINDSENDSTPNYTSQNEREELITTNEPNRSQTKIENDKIEEYDEQETIETSISNNVENQIRTDTTTTNIFDEKTSIQNEEESIHHHPTHESGSIFSEPGQSLEHENLKTEDLFSENHQTDAPILAVKSEETNFYGSIFKYFNFNSNVEQNNEGINVDQLIDDVGYCEDLQGDDSCPKNDLKFYSSYFFDNLMDIQVSINSDALLNKFLNQIIARADLVVFLLITAFTILMFLFGHYCFVHRRIENSLINKLNGVERKLICSQKEELLTKAELIETNKKLNSIADKSFGADDMIKQYEMEKNELQDQITSLEKELEIAAEAGLELNKMISELLSTQSGSDSIINSVEELQQQLNEQEANTIYINNLLAEKSRENSELQVLLSDSNRKFGVEIQELLNENQKLKSDKEKIEITLTESIRSLESELEKSLQTKANTISSINEEYSALKKKYDEIFVKWNSSQARVEVLEESMNKIEAFNGKDDIKTIIEIIDVNTKYVALKKQNESLRDMIDSEMDSKNRLQEQIKEISEDITRLRIEFNQNEKDKLEAQTRLEVLSSYFKEKESQLQKELSVKEALFMKQQGESTSTVERIRSLQDDIQKLRSQNDQLRAEVEAQSAAHKAQINAAEVRAHDSWLAAKQAERRLDEARAEASILRKKLTSITYQNKSAENNFTNLNQPNDGFISAPSPIHMESPCSPVLPLNLPPPPLIPAPLFANSTLGATFMPPPPLPLPNDMRPAPIGRLMSPPPPDHRYSENFMQQKRFQSNHYSDRDDYPSDIYETETDFSPPRSPRSTPPRSHTDFHHEQNWNYSPDIQTKKKSSFARKGSYSSDDEWDRQTF